MTMCLFDVGNRTRSVTAVAVLAVVAAVLITVPTAADAATSRRPAPVVAEGAGMGAKPSALVSTVQRALVRRGYDLGPPGVDGRFGPLTAAAVRRMQADHGLSVDGLVGTQTREALRMHLAVARTSRPSRERGPNTTQEIKTTSTQRSAARSVAPATAPGSVSTNLGARSSDWLGGILAGAIGGLIVLVLAMAAGMVHHPRSRARSRDPSSRSVPPASIARSAGGESAPQERTMSLAGQRSPSHSTAEVHFVAGTVTALSEREPIARDARSGLAEGPASGRPTGRPAVSHRPELLERIAAMRAANMTLQAIADQLNDEEVPTLRGGAKWRPSSIQAALGYRRPGRRDDMPPLAERGHP
jgi:hypothetical protein